MAKTNFDVIKVDLDGSNLIEASAGTGKTYSVAILVIRLIIEKRINLKEILMVTFTKAAVAELEVRIRQFIREAYAYISHGTHIDSTIRAIVDNGMQSMNKDEVLSLLNNARKQLDETSIFTIHGFCQKTLTEFAFETGQMFNSNVVEDEAYFINDATSEYWREHITVLETELLTFLLQCGLSKVQMTNVVSKAQGGKQFIYKSTHTVAQYWDMKAQAQKDLDDALVAFEQLFSNSHERTIENLGDKGYAFKAFGPFVNDATAFRIALIAKQDKGYTQKKCPILLEAAQKIYELEHAAEEIGKDCINYLYGEAISFCEASIQKKKKEQSLFSFDDLINKLHQTISSQSLAEAMRHQYKAVFIDEFQDTDQKQYEIFDTFFNGHSILFYIGDPKQSIYSFKGTDIDTYLDASQKVDHAYTMSKNYRSTANYIEAMNKLFTSAENPFYDARIAYEEVSAGRERSEIQLDGENVDPLRLYKCSRAAEVTEQTTNLVKDLLMGNYLIGGRKIKPSDIGILVRANSKGKEIKYGLNRFNIPAITIDDSRVLESEQSTLLLYLLKAIYEPNNNTINRVLLSCLTNKTKHQLLSFSIEVDVEFFKVLNKTWSQKGVFTAISAFMDKYNTLENLRVALPNDAERIISNVLQINEILHNKENQSSSSPKELIHWLETAIAGNEETGEFTQRLENDEDAVKIVTIHKSKGLAYNIVIAPFLDMQSQHNANWDFIEYKDTESHQYCFSSDINDTALRNYSEQAERENRRLIYVALTRAVYMGVIIHNTYKTKPNVGIKAFLDGAIAQQYFNFKSNLISNFNRYNEVVEEIDKTPKTCPTIPINSVWSNYSFSMLSQYEPHLMPEPIVTPTGYDHFIFNQFPKGALAGNFMHFLFENIDFTSSDFTSGIAKALYRYKSVFATVDEDLEHNITEMLNQVLQATIPTPAPFTLSQISRENMMPELAFDFKMKRLAIAHVQQLIPHIDFAREGEIEGMMSGFIDLLLEHDGRFYILDWKSNYLGNTVEDYTPDKLEHAMHQSNYHLQYYIYTLATKLYLQNCIPGFDYDTHFGGIIYVYTRGCRQGASNGIYYTKPDVKVIEELETLFVEQ